MTTGARPAIYISVLGLLLAACHKGGGSDIGPKLAPLPDFDYRVLVRDDSGRPITGATVRVSGAQSVPVTGRSGRAFLGEFHSGTRLITVDGTNAAALNTSQFGVLTVAAALPDGDELPYAFYLPDHATSAGLTLTTGVQGAPATLDDSGNDSGARLTVAAGDTVTRGSAAAVTVRTGKLSVGHLPRTLAAVGAAAIFASRAVYVHPADVQFATGASLSIPNDLVLSAAQPASLYRLSRTTGEWEVVGPAAETGGRIEAAAGSIKVGGLYAFGITAATTTTISGRVLDRDRLAVPGVLVRGPQAATRTAGDGRFTLPALARKDAANCDRTIDLEFDGGRNYLPVQIKKTITLDAATLDINDVEKLDTQRVTNVRMLMISRGRLDSNRRLRVSGREFLTVGDATGGDPAIAHFEDLSSEIIGFIATKPKDVNAVLRTHGLHFIHPDAVDNPINIHAAEVLWRPAQSNGTLLQIVDAFGTGPVSQVHIVTGTVPGEGYRGQTDLNGLFGVGIPLQGQATAVLQTTSDGRTVTSAFTVVAPDAGRLELPIERALRQGLGPFRRFGMVAGNLSNSGGSNTRTLRASGGMTLQDFYDEVFLGKASNLDAPVQTSPSGTSTAFRVGVPRGLGHLAGAEGTTTGGAFSLERLGIVFNVDFAEGALTTRDVPLTLIANQAFPITNAVADRHSAIANAALQFEVAGQLPSGLLVDLARGVSGANISVSGIDATLTLPALPSGFDRYMVGFGGSAVVGGTTVTQQIFARLDGQTTPDVPMLVTPTVTSPSAGGTVSGGGFSVGFIAPDAADYVVLNLRSETATDVRDWTVMLPEDRTQFLFHTLPSQAPQVLVAGRTWTLTVTCARIDSGLLVHPSLKKSQRFARIQTNWVGMQEAVREVSVFSSARITLTTN